MTPKEKAIELVSKMCLNDCTDENIEITKQCALIAVSEILNEYWSHDTKRRDWWQEVKQEIEKL